MNHSKRTFSGSPWWNKLVWLALTLAFPHLQGAPLAWVQREGYRFAPLAVPETGHAGFTLLPKEQTGIVFVDNLSFTNSVRNQILLNGAGVAAGDFDGDGLSDLYFCTLEGTNALYRNLGNWKFEDVTASAGAGCAHQSSRAAVLADLNGDGFLDLLVSSIGGPNACLFNDGQGHFRDVTRESGMVLKAGGHSYALADVDGDGDLDVYLANYGETSILRSGGTVSFRQVGGKPVVSGRNAARLKIIDGELIEYGEPDVLYLNDGRGRFTPLSWTGGAFLDENGQPLQRAPIDMGLSAMFRDLNGDGSPDLYVCNDFQTPDRIWINDGTGKFRAIAPRALRTTCHFSMGIDFADVDRDGRDDFFVCDMLSRNHRLRLTQVSASNPPPSHVEQYIDRDQVRHNTLLLNRGDGTYAEIAQYAGVDASDWTWTAIFLDVDLDGYEDLLVSNGHAYDTQDLDMSDSGSAPVRRSPPMLRRNNLKDYPPLHTPNVAFRNRGNRTFEEISATWGFNSTQVSHGMALADLDNDGDLDLVVNCLWTPALVYRNESNAPRLAVRLHGKTPNVQGIGAKIRVLGGPVPQSQEIISGGRYLSGDDPMRVFAAGSLTNRLTIEVTWRCGTQSLVENALPNHIYEIDEAGAKPAGPAGTNPAPSPPDFADVSARLGHVDDDRPFHDLERQPLLPKGLSEAGPGVVWFDLDGDGDDDLILGAAKGSFLTVYQNDGQGGFKRWISDAWNELFSDDLAGLAAWTPAPGQREILAVLGNYESAKDVPSSLLVIGPGLPRSKTISLPAPDCAGPLAVSDVDGDGDLDVFVGGRVIPGRYPEPASSLLFKNQNGKLEVDEVVSRVFRRVGLVNGAVFSDLNDDGRPDLVLACEWGPVRIFQNTGGQFVERTSELGLDKFVGWWNGVTTGDLDGDGRPDLIAGNWGLNSPYHDPSTGLVRMYYGDFDGKGTLDLVEAEREPETGRIVQRKDLMVMGAALPLLRVQFPTHKAYGAADVNAILGDQKSAARQVEVNDFHSMLFLNRGDHFETAPLPEPAQYAPVFAVNVGDLDNDGNEDVLLSQNFFANRPEEGRLDAGRALWLRGDGRGGLLPVPGQTSGILVYGQQRGAALSDFDRDGKLDLVVTQNGAETKLYRNQGANAGLRVKLAGPPQNPDGIGAVLRLVYGPGQRKGPAREIHAGSGYWSQDSATQVLSLAGRPEALWIRWPGGNVATYPLPAHSAEIVAEVNGTLKVLRRLP
jgi:enediyne biosynthesis protein E4